MSERKRVRPGVESSRRVVPIQCLVASLLVHAALVLPWVVMGRVERPPAPRPLVVELSGIVTGHQVAAQAAQAEAVPAAVPAAPPPAAAPKPDKPSRRRLRPIASPVPAGQLADKAAPAAAENAPAPPAEPVANARPATESDDRSRLQETVAVHETDADVLRRYLAGLKKTIQRRLSYPDEARQGGYVGSPVVSFTIAANGEIQPGSLIVRQSSGHAVLDESALAAARASAPFDPPPRPMQVAIAVSFEQDR